MFKRQISLLLTLCLVVGLLPFAAAAATDEQTNIIQAARDAQVAGVVMDVGDWTYEEVEPNNNAQSANKIGHDYTVIGMLSGQDVDCYYFEMDASPVAVTVAGTTANLLYGLVDCATGEDLIYGEYLGYDEESGLHLYQFACELPAGEYLLVFLEQTGANAEYLFYTQMPGYETHYHDYACEVTKEVSCTETGLYTYTCAGCGDSYTEVVYPWGHDFQDGKCVICDAVPGVVIASGQHDFGPVTWSLTSDGILTISGNRSLQDKNTYEWYDYHNMIREVVIENGITNVPKAAFERYERLEKVSIGNTVTSIGELAFYHCNDLHQISIPASVTEIQYSAFNDCTSLQQITFAPGSKLETVGNSAFRNCGLTNIALPSGVKYIGDYAFSNCESLTSAVLREGLLEVGDALFMGCHALTSMKLPESLTNIGEGMFLECVSLKELTIPAGVQTVAGQVFGMCSSLANIYFTGNAPSFGAWSFMDFSGTVWYPANNPTWTEDVRRNYYGNPVWKAYDAGGEQPKLQGLNCVDGVWGYYTDGELDTDYTNLVYYNDIFYYVENGLINWDYVGLAQHKETEVWYYVNGGGVDRSFTGLTMYNGRWFYLEAGSITWSYTGLVEFEGNWYYVQYSQLNFDYTGLVLHGDVWYYVQDSVLSWGQYTLVNHGGTWYYVQNSMLQWGYYGLVNYNGVWYYLENSQITWNFTDLVLYNDVWYYVKGSTIAWDYTGVVPYGGGMYYVENGTINWGYYGSFTQDGVTYEIANGTVVA